MFIFSEKFIKDLIEFKQSAYLIFYDRYYKQLVRYALTFLIIPPLSISAPLAFCAFIILSVSSIKVGMKRKAIVIIMDIVWTAFWSPMNLSGFNNRSIASVKSLGVVV